MNYQIIYKQATKMIGKAGGVHMAATGTIYVTVGERTARIADHEPNYAMTRQRGEADLEIYTRDVENKQIGKEYEVIDQLADFFGITPTGTVKAYITRCINREVQEAKELAIRLQQVREEMKETRAKKEAIYDRIHKAVNGDMNAIIEMQNIATRYGEENPKKANKRARAKFRMEFEARYGFRAERQDVVSAFGGWDAIRA